VDRDRRGGGDRDRAHRFSPVAQRRQEDNGGDGVEQQCVFELVVQLIELQQVELVLVEFHLVVE